MLNRRTFVGASLAAIGCFNPTIGLALAPRKQLKLLILGGTGFLGPHTVQAALDGGHEITLFNRGRTNPHLFPELEKLRGDRDSDLTALVGRQWDAVIDTSGHVPRVVEKSASVLANAVKQYLFVSTVSVYASFAQAGITEQSALATIADPTIETVTGQTYGPLKALCEKAALRQMPGRTSILRSGLIAGPGDRTDRFTYWPARLERGGQVLAPGSPGSYTQFVDVRDVARFIIHCLEQRLTDIYNVDRPARSLTTEQLLTESQPEVGKAELVWANEAFLAKHRVRAWSDMPLWMPDKGRNAGFGEVNCSKAAAAGLTVRSVVSTARATMEWFTALPPERQANLRAGLSPAREQRLLERLLGQRE